MSRAAAVIGICLCAAALGGCLTSRGDGSQQIETTSEAKQDSFQGAATAPLRDVNLLRTKIPAVLLAAVADPYAPPPGNAKLGRKQACVQITALLAPLDDALGPDLDRPKTENSMRTKGEHAAFGAMADAASDTIPFHGFVRKLTGAERHDRLVQEAINAGSTRRAYLKGLGEARGCNPPAAPLHAEVAAELPVQQFDPRYPIR